MDDLIIMMTIGKLAKKVGVGVETIRYYHRQNLLEIPSTTSGFRLYSEEHARRLQFIKRAQTAGFTLQEISRLLQLDATRDHAKAQELAIARLHALDEQIESLQSARSALQKLAHDCEHNRGQPCPIIAAFVPGE